jgi:hypothetical protein
LAAGSISVGKLSGKGRGRVVGVATLEHKGMQVMEGYLNRDLIPWLQDRSVDGRRSLDLIKKFNCSIIRIL